MDEPDRFVIDLKDPEDLRAKLAEAVRILRAKTDQLERVRKLQAEVVEWQATVAFLRARVPEQEHPQSIRPVVGQRSSEAATADANGRPPSARTVVDLAVEVVDREVRAIRALAVWKTLMNEGHDLDRVSVSNALHYAAHKAKRIKPARGRGMYAPLAYAEPDLPLGPEQVEFE